MATRETQSQTELYHLRVNGALDPHWSDGVDGFVVTPRDGETLLSGTINNQTALFEVLSTIHRQGLPLILLSRIECPCTSKSCPRRGDCQACAQYERGRGVLPICMRSRNKWDKRCAAVTGS